MPWNPEDEELTASQEDLFNTLTNITQDEPLPSELPIDDPVFTSERSKALILPDSDLDVLNEHLDEANACLTTTRNFYKWFSTLEDSISNVQLEEANKYRLVLWKGGKNE